MTYFNPLFIVTRAIVKAVKKLYRGIKETAAFSGSGLSQNLLLNGNPQEVVIVPKQSEISGF